MSPGFLGSKRQDNFKAGVLSLEQPSFFSFTFRSKKNIRNSKLVHSCVAALTDHILVVSRCIKLESTQTMEGEEEESASTSRWTCDACGCHTNQSTDRTCSICGTSNSGKFNTKIPLATLGRPTVLREARNFGERDCRDRDSGRSLLTPERHN